MLIDAFDKQDTTIGTSVEDFDVNKYCLINAILKLLWYELQKPFNCIMNFTS